MFMIIFILIVLFVLLFLGLLNTKSQRIRVILFSSLYFVILLALTFLGLLYYYGNQVPEGAIPMLPEEVSNPK